MNKNSETIIGVFNGKKGALSWAIMGECYRLIFTSKRLIVAEAKLKFWQRFIWRHEFNWITASEKEIKNVKKKSPQDYCNPEQIIEEIPYSEIKAIRHAHVANVINVKFYSDSNEIKKSYDIPLQSKKEDIFNEFFNLINSLLNSTEQIEKETDLSNLSSKELVDLIMLIDKREQESLTKSEEDRLEEIYSKVN